MRKYKCRDCGVTFQVAWLESPEGSLSEGRRRKLERRGPCPECFSKNISRIEIGSVVQ